MYAFLSLVILMGDVCFFTFHLTRLRLCMRIRSADAALMMQLGCDGGAFQAAEAYYCRSAAPFADSPLRNSICWLGDISCQLRSDPLASLYVLT